MVRRFHADPIVRTAEALALRAPGRHGAREADAPRARNARAPAPARRATLEPWPARPDAGFPQAHVLSNGRYRVLVSDGGGGQRLGRRGAHALAGRHAPSTAPGFRLFVRDLDRRLSWSVAPGDGEMVFDAAHGRAASARPRRLAPRAGLRRAGRRRRGAAGDAEERDSVPAAARGDELRRGRRRRCGRGPAASGVQQALRGERVRRGPARPHISPPPALRSGARRLARAHDGAARRAGAASWATRARASASWDAEGRLRRPGAIRPRATDRRRDDGRDARSGHGAVGGDRAAGASHHDARVRHPGGQLARERPGARPPLPLAPRARVDLRAGAPAERDRGGRSRRSPRADLPAAATLLSLLLYPHDALRRSRHATLAKNRLGQRSLWKHAISGDLPILLVRIGSAEDAAVLPSVLRAHRFWRGRGISVDVVILNEQAEGYVAETDDHVERAIAQAGADGLAGSAGGRVRRPFRSARRGRAHPAAVGGARGARRIRGEHRPAARARGRRAREAAAAGPERGAAAGAGDRSRDRTRSCSTTGSAASAPTAASTSSISSRASRRRRRG